MTAYEYMGLVQSEIEATKDLLAMANEANDPVGRLQMKRKLKELNDELLSTMRANP